MDTLTELSRKIKRMNHQGMPLTNFFVILKEYWPLGQYMLRKFGWRSWYSFWYTKLFVADEGGEYALLNHVYKRFPRLLKTPYKIEIEHTTICDKKCILCEHTYWNEKATRISINEIKHVVDSLPNLRWINLTGEGTNFLNKDFIPTIKYLRNKHVNLNFVDEFDFLDDEIAKLIIGIGVNSIYVSFDAATKETYETIKKGCDYDRALRNIRTLLRLKREMNSPFPVVHFRFIVTTLNYQEMPEYIELVASLGDRGVRAKVEFVGLLTFPGIESYYQPLENIPESIVSETYKNAIKHGINLYFTHAGTCLPSMERCAAWTEPYVMIGGEVISCCALMISNRRGFLRENSFGNAHSTPFNEIWNSAKYKEFRQLVNRKDAKVPNTCQGCRAFDTGLRAAKSGIKEWC